MTLLPDKQALLTECLGGINTELAGEVKRFLELVSRTPYQLVPSKAVDDVIHQVLKSPELLTKIEKFLGGKLVHNPGLTGQAMASAYRQTLELYRSSYGEPPKSVWACLDKMHTSASNTQPSICGVNIDTEPSICGLSLATKA